MIRRLAAVSALILAGLAASPAAQAQGYFSFFDAPPRDVVDRLYEQGFSVRLPMVRRGDVYIVDAVSGARRSVRLIVSVHDGRILERYATDPRGSDETPRSARWRDEDPRNADDSDEPRWERRTHTALGDPADAPARDGEFDPHPTPPAPLTDDTPRHHARKRPADAPSVASAPADVRAAPTKPVDAPFARPTPAPSSQAKVEDKPAPRVVPVERPTTDARVETAPAPKPTTVTAVPQTKVEDKPAPRMIPLTKPSPAPTSDAKVEDKPAPKMVEAPKAPAAQANGEDKPTPKPAKPEAPRKKLNDLPVGTLD